MHSRVFESKDIAVSVLPAQLLIIEAHVVLDLLYRTSVQELELCLKVLLRLSPLGNGKGLFKVPAALVLDCLPHRVGDVRIVPGATHARNGVSRHLSQLVKQKLLQLCIILLYLRHPHRRAVRFLHFLRCCAHLSWQFVLVSR